MSKHNIPNRLIPTATETTEGLVTLAPGLVDDDTKPVSSKDAKDAIDAVGLTAETNTLNIEEMQEVIAELQSTVQTQQTVIESISDNLLVVGNIYTFYTDEPESDRMAVADGSIITTASLIAPKLVTRLNEFPLKQLTRTEAEWQTIYANDALWRGNQGACGYFVLNLVEDTIRLPDLRGLTAEFTGFDNLTVGGVHGDMIRNIASSIDNDDTALFWNNGIAAFGAFYFDLSAMGHTPAVTAGPNPWARTMRFDPSRIVPTGNANKPRAVGLLPCVYLG